VTLGSLAQKRRQLRILDWVAHSVSRQLKVGAKMRLSGECRVDLRIAAQRNATVSHSVLGSTSNVTKALGGSQGAIELVM
jgi:hypothetical protein